MTRGRWRFETVRSRNEGKKRGRVSRFREFQLHANACTAEKWKRDTGLSGGGRRGTVSIDLPGRCIHRGSKARLPSPQPCVPSYERSTTRFVGGDEGVRPVRIIFRHENSPRPFISLETEARSRWNGNYTWVTQTYPPPTVKMTVNSVLAVTTPSSVPHPLGRGRTGGEMRSKSRRVRQVWQRAKLTLPRMGMAKDRGEDFSLVVESVTWQS